MAPKATWKAHTEHGDLDTKDRKDLPDSAYAFPKQRKEPLTDASHVKTALARFDQVDDVSDADRDLAFENIKAAASNVVTVPAFLETGGSFPPNFDSSKLTVTAWGSLKFTFTDCAHGTVDWIGNDASHAAGFMDTSFPIQQLTKIPGTACP